MPAQSILEDLPSGTAEERRRLPRVLSDAPAAVLMLDTARGTVTYTNALARRLASVDLPAPVADWEAAAGLRNPSDDEDPGPLQRAGRGERVHGVPVLVPSADDQRARVLWVTASPLPAVTGLDAVSLVVLLPVDPGLLADDLLEVRSRALVAAGLSFTITDPHRPDNPLVWVNPAFLATTGYEEAEVLGRNCRFLQGPDTDPRSIARLRQSTQQEEPEQVVLLNYRKDGTAFWNEVSVSPVFDAAGRLSHFVGVQSDVTLRVEAELLREERMREEQQARERSEDARERLALLADATETLVASLDVEEALTRLAHLLVPRVADWCLVRLAPDGEAGSGATVVTATGADREQARAAVETLLPRSIGPRSRIGQVMATGEPALLERIGDEDLHGVGSEELVQAYRGLGLGSAVVVPLTGRHGVLGALALVTSASGRTYDEVDLQLASDLARRAGLIVDNARLYAREHRVAEALQRSMLPELPRVPGLDIAARYLPGGVGAQVGGDWFDVLPLPDGSVGVAIGDVMGHDMAAAAAMGQLRSVLRSYAWQRQTPGQVLDSLDRLVQGLDMAQLATAVFARLRLEEETEDGVVVEYANAGHLPPMVLRPDGTVHRLSGAWSVLIGAPDEGARETDHEVLAPGSTLVLATDGLVEVRGRDLDAGLDRLEEVLAGLRDAPDAQTLLDTLLKEVRPEEADDDIAVLVVRLLAPTDADVRLPPDRTAPAEARRQVRHTLAGVPEEVLQLALLLTSELVSNAVQHGDDPIGLRISRHRSRVRVAVLDGDPEPPELRRQVADVDGYPPEGGRGIFLLDSLADRWGDEPDGTGKQVWFELDLPQG